MSEIHNGIAIGKQHLNLKGSAFYCLISINCKLQYKRLRNEKANANWFLNPSYILTLWQSSPIRLAHSERATQFRRKTKCQILHYYSNYIIIIQSHHKQQSFTRVQTPTWKLAWKTTINTVFVCVFCWHKDRAEWLTFSHASTFLHFLAVLIVLPTRKKKKKKSKGPRMLCCV